MTREQAEARREQLAKGTPEATWVVAGSDAGGWKVIRVDLAPAPTDRTETSEERPRPPHPDDVRTLHQQQTGGNNLGPGF